MKTNIQVLDEGTRVLWQVSNGFVGFVKLPKRTHRLATTVVFFGLLYVIYYIIRYRILGW